jgi:hypothetical protein
VWGVQIHEDEASEYAEKKLEMPLTFAEKKILADLESSKVVNKSK